MLYLIRHAGVEPQADLPATEWPLSSDGVAQATDLAALSEWQTLSRVVSSPERKARATAEPIARAAGLPLSIECGLREVGRPRGFAPPDEYRAAVDRVFAGQQLDGWETAAAALRRIREVIDSLADEPVCAVVSHGLLLAIYMAWLAGRGRASLAEWAAVPMPAIAVVDPLERRIVRPFAAAPR